MKKIMLFVALSAVAFLAAAQAKPFGLYDLSLGTSASAQGASVINGGFVTFAWGGGLRGSAQVNPIARMNLALEYMDRGMDFNLKTLDLSAIMTFGDPFFYGLGLYGGLILNMDPARGWKNFATAELGWATDIGYRFKSVPGLKAGFDVHMGLTDMMPHLVSSEGFVNQLDIRWGLWLGYDFLRGLAISS
jgi:hypothetical protein